MNANINHRERGSIMGDELDLDLDVFDGIENARDSFSRNYLPTNGDAVGSTASYTLEVKNVKYDRTRKKVPYVAAHFSIIESNCPAMRKGDAADYFTGADKDGFQTNVRNLCAAMLGSGEQEPVDEASVTKDVVGMVIKDNGEMVRGKLIRATVTKVATKGGGIYSAHIFAPVLAPVPAAG
jgi:hypothetical protein